MYCKSIKYTQGLEYLAQKNANYSINYFHVDYMLKSILDILDYITILFTITFTCFFLFVFNMAIRKF